MLGGALPLRSRPGLNLTLRIPSVFHEARAESRTSWIPANLAYRSRGLPRIPKEGVTLRHRSSVQRATWGFVPPLITRRQEGTWRYLLSLRRQSPTQGSSRCAARLIISPGPWFNSRCCHVPLRRIHFRNQGKRCRAVLQSGLRSLCISALGPHINTRPPPLRRRGGGLRHAHI